MSAEINHIISSLAATAAIIMAIVGIIRSIHLERRAKRASDLVIAKASEAIRLASLAIERVSSSRASRLNDDLPIDQSDAHFFFCEDQIPCESLDDTSISPKDSKDLINES